MYNLDTVKIRSMSEKALCGYIADCEKSFDDELIHVAQEIAHRPEIRICGLAGPSCAGKTTGSYKLTQYLALHGIKVRTVSIDDFFHNKGEGPLDEQGKPDFESITYVKMELLQQTLQDILMGKRVMLPKFDFPNSRRIDNYAEYIPQKDEIIILEGLHALNDIMYEGIPREDYYRIFINVENSLSVDGQPLFTGRELRLMRRLIRDFKFRGADAQLTFTLWENVVKGEDRNIHPFEDRADFRLNSMFEYEPCTVKRQVLYVLSGLKADSIYLPLAQNIISKLEKIPYISEKLVSADSLMQEFLGGDYFNYDQR